MKHIGAILFLTATALTAVAQTNTAPTNAVRTMTLDQCITEALKHNFDVQVERYSPEISEENLYASYGGWDPTLSASGLHSYQVTGGGLSANQLVLPSDISDDNSFNA